MNRSPRKHTAEFKAKVALEAVQGDKTLVEIAAQYKLHPKQIQTWRKQLLDRKRSTKYIFPSIIICCRN